MTTPYRCVACGRVGTRQFSVTSVDQGRTWTTRCMNRRACENRQIRYPWAARSAS